MNIRSSKLSAEQKKEERKKIRHLLYVGQVFKNYKELCNYLNIPLGKSCSKAAQLRIINSVVMLGYSGQQLTVKDIYELQPEIKKKEKEKKEKKKVQHIRKCYVSYTIPILCNVLEDKCYTVTDIAKLLGIININYQSHNLSKEEKIFETRHFTNLLFNRFNTFIKYALHKMERQGIIEIYNTYMINNHVASEMELEEIYEIEQLALKSLGLNNYCEVIFHNKVIQYKNFFSKYDTIFSCMKIRLLNRDVQKLDKEKINEYQQILNDMFINKFKAYIEQHTSFINKKGEQIDYDMEFLYNLIDKYIKR